MENKNIKKTFYFISRDNNFLIFWASEEQIIYLLTVSNFLVFLLFILRRGWADCLAGCLALQDGTSSPMSEPQINSIFGSLIRALHARR